ncbi:MAG: bifunctional riboflavin kinase/FAD synthetase [Deltaproteobacteria bacterium]|nr:bifunctional riboflavin kinase/FAD synthetase [Deltaproteobacteria bacterium]
MNIVYELEKLERPLANPVLTIGNFDGVHRGHLALFNKVRERAGAIGGQSAVMTFEPHPVKLMKPHKGPFLITPTKQKLELIAEAGIDVLFCLRFDREFASIPPEDFVNRILLDKIGIREIVVGYDYTFGRRRRGNIALLREMGRRLGYTVHVMEPVHVNGTLVSSTSIRKCIREGDLAEAGRLLGRDYQIRGTVVRGQNRGGRLLGFPTANLEVLDELLPKPGVYAVHVQIEREGHLGVTNIGTNPTFGNGGISVETHILDFSENVLGKAMRISFIERLRDEKTFNSIEELSDQIARDIDRARRVFRSREAA